MPFDSQAQETWMKHNKPAMYRKWKREHGSYHNPKKSHPYTGDPWGSGKCLICGHGRKEHRIK